jgi:hypothetical protein
MKTDKVMFDPNSGAFRAPNGRFVTRDPAQLLEHGFTPDGDHLGVVDETRSQTWHRAPKEQA